MRNYAACLCCVFLLSLTACAKQRADAPVLSALQSAAEQGDAVAQNDLGVKYSYGHGGVPRDYAKAAQLFRKAAEQGLMMAQHNLGAMYATGRGVPQDYAKTVHWWEKAAEQGLALAQVNMGKMYENGRGVPTDYAKAMQWYQKAAEQGAMEACDYISMMYRLGRGVPKDGAKAAYWLLKASGLSPQESAVPFLMYLLGEGLGLLDKQKGCDRLHASAEQGNKEAMYLYSKFCTPESPGERRAP
ncbi:MAG: sel1 repeat family protein [Deltaproteobacteria bacterium]|jgi:TPR repeat protein|nr:sel1 repeat family protein [Deltaproteobacteria bacterium]